MTKIGSCRGAEGRFHPSSGESAGPIVSTQTLRPSMVVSLGAVLPWTRLTLILKSYYG